jgi:hypothetical protein
LVVLLFLFRVAEDRVSFLDLFKPGFCRFVSRVKVRMVLSGQLAVGFFYFGGGCFPLNPKNLVESLFMWTFISNYGFLLIEFSCDYFLSLSSSTTSASITSSSADSLLEA